MTSFSILQLELILILSLIVIKKATSEFYDLSVDHIEVVNSYGFKKNILHSNRVTILEFFVSWCGTCNSFKIVWKTFANLTILWQKKVLRVAAIDCDSIVNDFEVCQKNDVLDYPRFRMFSTEQNDIAGFKLSEKEDARSEQFMKSTIDFLEQQNNTRKDWPILKPYM